MDAPRKSLALLRQRLKLRQLRLVLMLDEERSVTRAAERLFISPAAVSKTRAELEAELGAAVFERVNNRLQPTEVGRHVLDAAKRIFAELESLDEEMTLLREGMRGTLTIGIRSVAAQPFIAEVTAAFKENHPELTIRLIDADFPSLLDQLGKGEVSLLISRISADQSLEGLESVVLLDDPNVVIASPSHPLAKKKKVDWPELVTQRWCLTPDGFAGRISSEHLNTFLAKRKLPPPKDLVETNSLLMQITMFQAGNYLSLAPLMVGYQLVQRRLARLINVPPLGPIDPVCLMWRANMSLSPVARHFRDFILEMLKTGLISPERIAKTTRRLEGGVARKTKSVNRQGARSAKDAK